MNIVALALHHESAVAAFEADFPPGERIPAWFADRSWTQDHRVEQVNGWAEGRYLQPGWVPCTTRFLEHEGELLGVVNVRHHLTDALRRVGGHIGYSVRPSARRRGHGSRLLTAGLAICASMGIEEALLTCDETNLGSIGVIRRCGGRRIEVQPRESGPAICRFLVPTRP